MPEDPPVQLIAMQNCKASEKAVMDAKSQPNRYKVIQCERDAREANPSECANVQAFPTFRVAVPGEESTTGEAAYRVCHVGYDASKGLVPVTADCK